MHIKEIEKIYGLPAKVEMPTNNGPIIRIIISREDESDHYLQHDPLQPNLGYFRCCYTKGVTERFFNDWKYLGKPEGEEYLV